MFCTCATYPVSMDQIQHQMMISIAESLKRKIYKNEYEIEIIVRNLVSQWSVFDRR